MGDLGGTPVCREAVLWRPERRMTSSNLTPGPDSFAVSMISLLQDPVRLVRLARRGDLK